MSIEAYRELVDEICVKINIPDPEPMYESADMCIMGVEFSMYHCGERSPDHGVVYCDFGPLPTEAREAVLLRLLQTNLFMFTVNSPTFTCNAENQHIVLAANVPLATATADALLATLMGVAEMAMEWRARHFLTHDEQMNGLKIGGTSASKSTLNRFASQFSKPLPEQQAIK